MMFDKKGYAIKDSGNRREFASGAVRDIQEGKGRCDLLPLHTVADFLDRDCVLYPVANFVRTGETNFLNSALSALAQLAEIDKHTMILEVAIHYQDGCNKYGERNWEKGIPVHCYIDSGVRHYLKWLRGDDDENHFRAAVWNLLGASWTHTFKPELREYPCNQEGVE